jgi:hypothetical protein
MIRVIWRVKIDQQHFFSRVSVISRSRYIEVKFAVLRGKFAGAKNFSRYIKNRVISRFDCILFLTAKFCYLLLFVNF